MQLHSQSLTPFPAMAAPHLSCRGSLSPSLLSSPSLTPSASLRPQALRLALGSSGLLGAPLAPVNPSNASFQSTSSRPSLSARASNNLSHVRGGISGKGLKFGVVVALFNDIVTKPLLEGALNTFERHGVDMDSDVQVVWVPGSFEIPVVTQKMAQSGKFDAILALGAVVRGSTTHYDAVANNAASGILSASLSSGLPCIFGVLTCETMEQAMDRAGGKLGNKGSETAVTAIEMANLMKML